jgi:hypothetical protein
MIIQIIKIYTKLGTIIFIFFILLYKTIFINDVIQQIKGYLKLKINN